MECASDKGTTAVQHSNVLAMLVAFGDLSFYDRALSAEAVFGRLMSRSVWLTKRLPNKAVGVPLPFRIVLYQKGVGVRAIASVTEITRIDVAELSRCLCVAAERLWFPCKLRLSEIKLLEPAVGFRPLLPQLSFIADKKRWGLSMRSTPRMISAADLEVIVKSAERTRPRRRRADGHGDMAIEAR